MSDSVWPHRQQPTRLLCPWDSLGKNTGVVCLFLLQCMKVKSESEVTQLCPTLSDPVDWRLPGSSIHGIFQARVLEWGAISFSRGSSWPRDRIPVSRIRSRCFTVWATKEVLVQGRKRKNYCSIAMSSNLLSDLLLYRRGLISWQTEVIFFLWICVINHKSSKPGWVK